MWVDVCLWVVLLEVPQLYQAPLSTGLVPNHFEDVGKPSLRFLHKPCSLTIMHMGKTPCTTLLSVLVGASISWYSVRVKQDADVDTASKL